MTDHQKQQLRTIVEELKKCSFVKAIYLFGSQAKKSQTPLSDIDLCIVDDPTSSKKERMKVYQWSEKPFDISLFSMLPLPIQFEALCGKIVFMRDRTYIHKVKVRTLQAYHDMVPLWKQSLDLRKSFGHRVVA